MRVVCFLFYSICINFQIFVNLHNDVISLKISISVRNALPIIDIYGIIIMHVL